MARLIVSLLLLNNAVLQYTHAKSSSISIGRSRRTKTLLTHQRNFQHGSLNDALLLSTRSPSLYSTNDILERLRGGGAFLSVGSNNNKDTASVSTKTSLQDDVSTGIGPISNVAAAMFFTISVALGYALGHLITRYVAIDTFKTCLISG